jgi:hypothetical protein
MVDIGAEHKLVVVGIQVVTVVIVVVDILVVMVGILVVVVVADIQFGVVVVDILVVVVGILVVVVGILVVVVVMGILVVADIQFGVVVVGMLVADHKVVGSLEEVVVLEKVVEVVDFLEDIDSNFHVDDVHVHIHVHVQGIHHVDQKLDIHLVVGSNFVAVVDHED